MKAFVCRDQTAELKSLHQDGQSNYNKSMASEYSVTSATRLIHSTSTPTGILVASIAYHL